MAPAALPAVPQPPAASARLRSASRSPSRARPSPAAAVPASTAAGNDRTAGEPAAPATIPAGQSQPQYLDPTVQIHRGPGQLARSAPLTQRLTWPPPLCRVCTTQTADPTQAQRVRRPVNAGKPQLPLAFHRKVPGRLSIYLLVHFCSNQASSLAV